MASVWIKEEVTFDSDVDVQELEKFQETEKFVNIEVKFGEHQKQSDESLSERENEGRLLRRQAILCREFRCNQFPPASYCEPTLSRSTFRFLKAVSLMRSLAEDYYHMSQNKKSEYCSKLHPEPVLVQCSGCSQPFLGRNRILALHQHIQTWHHKEAKALALHFMTVYKSLLVTMKAHFDMDRRLIAFVYG